MDVRGAGEKGSAQERLIGPERGDSQLRRAQQALELSRARYLDLYDLAPIAYLTLNPSGLIQEANLTAAALLEVSRTELSQQPLSRFILEPDLELYQNHRRELIQNGVRQVCELRIVTRRHSQCWVRLEATVGLDASGVLAVRAVLSDITERRRAEEALRASEVRHRILFERSHDALMTLAPPDWRFTSGNSATLRLFGVADEASFLAHHPSAFSPEWQLDGSASAEKARSMIDTAMREGSHFYEWTYQRPSGQVFPATVLLTRLEIDGNPLLQATVRDETEVKRWQAMLCQSDRLASMGTLAASVAHEINNPLTYVLYNLDGLVNELPKIDAAVQRCLGVLRGKIGERAFAAVVADDSERLEPVLFQELLERSVEARDGAARIRTIARAIGAFSRLESTQRSRVDLNVAIESALAMALTAVRQRAQLVVDFGRLPPVWASEGKLSQVFLNLLINAVQAIEEGDSARNQVRIHSWSDADHVFATVEDTGRGIAKEHVERIFEPFFTTKPAGVGSGLGLCICRNIVTDFGGELSIESEVGQGTCFQVRLPIQALAGVGPRAVPALVLPGLPALSGRILIVDDEPAIRTMLAEVLGSSHQVRTAESGVAARRLLEQDQSFDVILCDLMMTEMTGMDLHEWLATHHPCLAERLVFTSGGAFTPLASEYVRRVGNLLLEKPFDIQCLVRVVRERLFAQAKTAETHAERAPHAQ